MRESPRFFDEKGSARVLGPEQRKPPAPRAPRHTDARASPEESHDEPSVLTGTTSYQLRRVEGSSVATGDGPTATPYSSSVNPPPHEEGRRAEAQ